MEAFALFCKKATGERSTSQKITWIVLKTKLGPPALQFPLLTTVITSEGAVLLSTKQVYRIVLCCVASEPGELQT